MAARLNPAHDARTREKIQTSQLLNRLQDHVFGKVELTPTQVRAAEVLIRKTLPDLTTTTLQGPGGGDIQLNVVSGVPRANS